MLAVTGSGMVSALGLDVTTSCGAARAGIQRLHGLDTIYAMDDDEEESVPVAGHTVPLIASGLFGFARLTRLCVAALDNLRRNVTDLDAGRLGFVLLLPSPVYRDACLGFPPADDVDPDEQAADAARFRSSDERIKSELLARVLGETGLRVEPALRSTFLGTCVGLVEALRQAQDWLERGACDRCIVGAVDSLVEANVLAPLSLLGLLKTVARPVGMLPGEAAAFHVLRRAPSGAQPPADVRALVGVPMAATGSAHPLMHPQPVNREETLASAISQAVAATFGGRFDGVVVSNLNGDAYRATSWSQVWLHLRNVAGFAVPLHLVPVPRLRRRRRRGRPGVHRHAGPCLRARPGAVVAGPGLSVRRHGRPVRHSRPRRSGVTGERHVG